jgi:ribonuclease T1
MSRQNRPTDSFGGPPMRGNNISLVLVLAALAVFAVMQWTTRGSNTDVAPATATVAAVAADAPTAVEAGAEDASVEDASLETAAASMESTPPVDDGASEAQPRGGQTPSSINQPTPTANAPPAPTRASDLPTIAYSDLPPEAHDTINVIESDGPFPYSRDGLTFQNRERILPRHPEGYYHEYTVITPGSSDRGARRIVTGEGGEMYYTDDHYTSFREIVS